MINQLSVGRSFNYDKQAVNIAALIRSKLQKKNIIKENKM